MEILKLPDSGIAGAVLPHIIAARKPTAVALLSLCVFPGHVALNQRCLLVVGISMKYDIVIIYAAAGI